MATGSIADAKPRFSYLSGSRNQLEKRAFNWSERQFSGSGSTPREWGTNLNAGSWKQVFPAFGGAIPASFSVISEGPVSGGMTVVSGTPAVPAEIIFVGGAAPLAFDLTGIIPAAYLPSSGGIPHPVDDEMEIRVNGVAVLAATRLSSAGIFEIFNGLAGATFVAGNAILVNFNYTSWPVSRV